MKNTVFRAMGTDVEIIVNELNGQIESKIDQAIQFAHEKMIALESRLSRFRGDSEVSLINSNSGQWLSVSHDTVQILLLAQNAFIKTGGFFNPFMGQVLENLGYKVTFENIESEADRTLPFAIPFIAPIHSPLQIDESEFRVRIEPGYQIDLGGIAKGWIVEKTADVLIENGVSNFICNAGGDLVCKGDNDGIPWVIGITNPFDQLKSIVNLDVKNMCVATSGTYRRKWFLEDREVHHIVDPFLGEPARTDIASCTVVHPSLVEAEIMAKVALILGTATGIPWLRNQATNRWVIVNSTGEVKYSCNL